MPNGSKFKHNTKTKSIKMIILKFLFGRRSISNFSSSQKNRTTNNSLGQEHQQQAGSFSEINVKPTGLRIRQLAYCTSIWRSPCSAAATINTAAVFAFMDFSPCAVRLCVMFLLRVKELSIHSLSVASAKCTSSGFQEPVRVWMCDVPESSCTNLSLTL